MTKATPVYRAIILGCEERRVALGMSMEKLSEFAGLPDRYYAKAVHVDEPSGRQASWQTLQIICDVLWPDGFGVAIKPHAGLRLDAQSLQFKVRYEQQLGNGKTRREFMSEIGRKGGEALKLVRLTKISKRRRRQIAKAAAIARHSKTKIQDAMACHSKGPAAV